MRTVSHSLLLGHTVVPRKTQVSFRARSILPQNTDVDGCTEKPDTVRYGQIQSDTERLRESV